MFEHFVIETIITVIALLPHINFSNLRSFVFWTALDRRIVSVKLVLYLTNGFHVAVRLFSNRSQMTSKYGKNKKMAHEAQPSVSLMFLPHFDVLCDLLLNRRTATWNLFVLYNKELKYTGKKPFYFKFRHFDRHENSTLT